MEKFSVLDACLMSAGLEEGTITLGVEIFKDECFFFFLEFIC